MTPSEKIAQEMVARFPITFPPFPNTNVANQSNAYDVALDACKVSLNKTASDPEIGRLDSTVRLHCGEDLSGFQGGVYYRFLDDKGNVVYAMLGDIYGVNGKLIPGAPSDVTKFEVKYIPLDVLSGIHKIEVIPARMEGPALDNLRKTVDDLAKGAEIIKDGVKKIGASIAEIAAAIKVIA